MGMHRVLLGSIRQTEAGRFSEANVEVFDSEKPFKVNTGAWDEAIGRNLAQEGHHITFKSRKGEGTQLPLRVRSLKMLNGNTRPIRKK